VTAQEFDELVERRLGLIRATLVSKGREYASSTDRLHNFNRGALVQGISPAACLRGYMTKHLVSVLDIIEAVEDHEGGYVPPAELIDEKLGDLINYCVLLEAVLVAERRRHLDAQPEEAGS